MISFFPVFLIHVIHTRICLNPDFSRLQDSHCNLDIVGIWYKWLLFYGMWFVFRRRGEFHIFVLYSPKFVVQFYSLKVSILLMYRSLWRNVSFHIIIFYNITEKRTWFGPTERYRYDFTPQLWTYEGHTLKIS